MLAPFSIASAQRDSLKVRITVEDIVGTSIGSALYVSPGLFNINHHYPACAPCDRSRIWWLDRWAVGNPRVVWQRGSDVLLIGLAGATWLEMYRRHDGGLGKVAASVQAASLAAGTSAMLKAIIARRRPILYTPGAAALAADYGNQRSFPSGHATIAFALATMYWLEQGRHDAAWKTWAAVAVASTVGLLRIAAAEHFPSDVVAGAALGMGSAVAVYRLRF